MKEEYNYKNDEGAPCRRHGDYDCPCFFDEEGEYKAEMAELRQREEQEEKEAMKNEQTTLKDN